VKPFTADTDMFGIGRDWSTGVVWRGSGNCVM